MKINRLRSNENQIPDKQNVLLGITALLLQWLFTSHSSDIKTVHTRESWWDFLFFLLGLLPSFLLIESSCQAKSNILWEFLLRFGQSFFRVWWNIKGRSDPIVWRAMLGSTSLTSLSLCCYQCTRCFPYAIYLEQLGGLTNWCLTWLSAYRLFSHFISHRVIEETIISSRVLWHNRKFTIVFSLKFIRGEINDCVSKSFYSFWDC